MAQAPQRLRRRERKNITAGVAHEIRVGSHELPALWDTEDEPIEALTGLACSNGDINATQLLGILQAFGGTQDWSAKLNNGEVPADPTALQQLSDAANGVNPAPAGTPLPPEAVNAALATLNQ